MALKRSWIFLNYHQRKTVRNAEARPVWHSAMKVAQGAVEHQHACPYFSEEALATLSEATAPPMKTIKVGTGEAELHTGRRDRSLQRHEKTFVSKTEICSISSAAAWMKQPSKQNLLASQKVDYDRIGERMHVEMLYLSTTVQIRFVDDYVELVKKAAGLRQDAGTWLYRCGSSKGCSGCMQRRQSRS